MGKADIPDAVYADTLLTSHQVAGMLQVNPSSIGNWVTSGRLKAFRTPGGHRRIRGRDLVAFLEQHDLPIPPPLAHAMRRRVLWVEENGELRASAERSLEPHDRAVEVAFQDDLDSALLEVGSARPHLVVLSAGNDPERALRVARSIKQHPALVSTEVLLTAPAPHQSVDSSARQIGARGCVHSDGAVEAALAALDGR